jgi:hypothetical protein
LQHYHGDAAAGWPLAAWQAGRRQGVSALHGVALDSLQSAADRAGVRLLGVAPWWARVLQQAAGHHARLRAGAARLLVVEGAHITALSLDEGRLGAIELRRLEEASTAALARWNGARPDRLTVAVGYGLSGDAVEGTEAPLPLNGAGPAADWIAT